MFNGTVGIVTAPNPDEQSPTVRTEDDEFIDYNFDELAHAYATTIHRCQGSEYPVVVIPITPARG